MKGIRYFFFLRKACHDDKLGRRFGMPNTEDKMQTTYSKETYVQSSTVSDLLWYVQI